MTDAGEDNNKKFALSEEVAISALFQPASSRLMNNLREIDLIHILTKSKVADPYLFLDTLLFCVIPRKPFSTIDSRPYHP
jgi:hypothetical protein